MADIFKIGAGDSILVFNPYTNLSKICIVQISNRVMDLVIEISENVAQELLFAHTDLVLRKLEKELPSIQTSAKIQKHLDRQVENIQYNSHSFASLSDSLKGDYTINSPLKKPEKSEKENIKPKTNEIRLVAFILPDNEYYVVLNPFIADLMGVLTDDTVIVLNPNNNKSKRGKILISNEVSELETKISENITTEVGFNKGDLIIRTIPEVLASHKGLPIAHREVSQSIPTPLASPTCPIPQADLSITPLQTRTDRPRYRQLSGSRHYRSLF